ncbi:universal stress protein [Bacteroidia bacterium]|nr:universal stress protein [Bacteroidia bacterium]MDB9883117.1 universal stress protein [Bacteroidia bacterium]
MEKAFNKILLAYDNSEAAVAALQSAYGVATKFNSQITALVVHGKDDNLEDSRAALESFNKEKRLNMEIIERSGAVYDEVIKLEKEMEFGLILLGSHGTKGWQKLWMGSNAFKVITSSTCPVISVTAKASSSELKNILLPIGDSRNTRQKVPYCIKMAKAFGATVHIIGVSKSKSADTEKHITSYINQTQQFLASKGVKSTSKISFGVKVAETCIEYAEEVNAGLMMIMSETESSGLFMDSYSQQLVNNSTVPIMSIHARDTRLTGATGY